MQSYFTIISANIRPEIDEKISIGLLLVSGRDVYFNYSKEKLNVTKELLPAVTQRYLKDTIKQIATEIGEYGKAHLSLDANEFSKQHDVFKASYIHYLTRYSNGVLNFSDPKQIDLAAEPVLLQSLFRKYIDENTGGISNSKPNKFDAVKGKFYSKIDKQFNIEKEFTSNEIPKLIVPIKIDMIGKNERVVYAQSIDLERRTYNIQTDIGIVATLKQIYNGQAQGYIISSEPDKKAYPEQHQTWQNMRDNTLAEYVDVSEIERIKEYADEHNVKPLTASV